MRLIIRLALLLICSVSFAQTNLLDTSSWFEGTGSVAGFSKTGDNEENIREIGIGPHGFSVLLWKTIPGATGNSGAGGWATDVISIDPSKTYRFTVWIKKTNSFDGATYFRAVATNGGAVSVANIDDDSFNGNPFFWGGDPPTLDTWYLLVGYMHSHTLPNTVSSIGGIYNGNTGVKMLSATDYKFQSDAVQINQSIWLSDNTNTSDSQFYYGPTMYEVNGQEPSIQDLINAHPDNQVPSKPTLSSNAKTDTTIDLSWTAATDNIAVTGYKVYKGGVETSLGNVLNYQVTGLTASTAYSFTVTAVDAAGNESIASNILNTTTDSTPVPATNLLDTSSWTLGTGSVFGFNILGTSNENIREIGIGPHGASEVLWKVQPENDSNKGWDTDYVNIDHTKTYRYTSWVKKTNSNDGVIYLSFTCKDDIGNNTGLNLSGSINGAPYVFSGDTPHLDQWYLLVGYIHQSAYSSTTSIGGVYDVNGVKQSNMTDYKFSNTATRFSLKNYLKFSTDLSNRLFIYGPTIYEINGQEPTIQELIGSQPNNTQNPPNGNAGYWSLNNQDVYYNTGNVGIGTTTPDEKLTVKGSIHSEEVKVDLSVPAPDYVFEADYHLTPLEQLRIYIKQNKHLPNIPTAKEMEANGIELGVMNMKLLEKMEELTLYILEQESRIKKLEKLLNKK